LLYFEARRRFEAKAFHAFNQGDLDRLREDLRRFSGDWWHAWYQRWCIDGEQVAAPDVPSLLEPSRTREPGSRFAQASTGHHLLFVDANHMSNSTHQAGGRP